MANADERIRVSDRVKRELDRRQRDGESYNDVLERILEGERVGAFSDGFGRWSDEERPRPRGTANDEGSRRRRGVLRKLVVPRRRFADGDPKNGGSYG